MFSLRCLGFACVCYILEDSEQRGQFDQANLKVVLQNRSHKNDLYVFNIKGYLMQHIRNTASLINRFYYQASINMNNLALFVKLPLSLQPAPLPLDILQPLGNELSC